MDPGLTTWLHQQRDRLVPRWADEIRATYPRVRIKFSKAPGQFNDPLGHMLARDLPVLFELVIDGAFDDPACLQTALDPICRLRSVQEFSAGEAVGWVFSLKKILRDALFRRGEGMDGEAMRAMLELESSVDRLALHAFDLHMSCREEVYDLRSREARRQSDIIVNHFAKQGKRMFDSAGAGLNPDRPDESNGHGGERS